MGIENGKKVTFDYTVSTGGETVDSSEGIGPFVYVHGKDGIIPGLAEGLEGMEEGDKKTISVPPEKAYGERSDSAFQEIPRSALKDDVEPEVGMTLESATPTGARAVVRISEVKEDSIVVDMNHPLAGKTLTFDVEIRSVE